MKLYCHYCPESFPHFRALLEHYESQHAQHLRQYAVVNKSGKGRGAVKATLNIGVEFVLKAGIGGKKVNVGT